MREAVIYCTRTPGALLDPEKDDGSMISIEECAKQMLASAAASRAAYGRRLPADLRNHGHHRRNRGCSKADSLGPAEEPGDAWACASAFSSGIGYDNGKMQVGRFSSSSLKLWAKTTHIRRTQL